MKQKKRIINHLKTDWEKVKKDVRLEDIYRTLEAELGAMGIGNYCTTYPIIDNDKIIKLGLTLTEKIPDILYEMKELQCLELKINTTVDLEGDNIPDEIQSTVPKGTCELTQLKSLRIRTEFEITELILPDCIGNLTKLEKLQISEATLKNLPSTIGNLINMKELILDRNEILTLPDSIGNLINLNSLDLSENKIISLPDSIGNLINLNSLELRKNKLVTLPEGIGNLLSLERLNLNYNHLTSVPDSIGNIGRLRHLLLEENKITSIPENIERILLKQT